MIYENNNGRSRTKCLCKCDCGNTTVSSYDSLRRGKTSCGCDTKEKTVSKIRKDYTGKRFGRLVVNKMDYSHRPALAECLCDCGNSTIVIATQLSNGRTKSCGCLQKDVASERNTKDWNGVVSDYGVSFIKKSRQNDKQQWLWICKCGICGKEFEELPAKIMNGHTTSCGCKKSSSMELFIKQYLDSIEYIDYKREYRFDDCKYKYRLPFDFAVFDKSGSLMFVIEYDGEQHYKEVGWFGGKDGFDARVRNDNIKTDYCKSHGIPLLRLSFDMTKDDILKSIENYLSVETVILPMAT